MQPKVISSVALASFLACASSSLQFAQAQVVVLITPPFGSQVPLQSVELEGLVVGFPGPAPVSEVLIRTRYPNGTLCPPVGNDGAYDEDVLGWGYDLEWDSFTGLGTFSGRAKWFAQGQNFIDIYLPTDTLGSPSYTHSVTYQPGAVNLNEVIAGIHPKKRTIDVLGDDQQVGELAFLVDLINTSTQLTYDIRLEAKVELPSGDVVDLPMGGPGLPSAFFTIEPGDFQYTSIVDPQGMTFAFPLDSAPFPAQIQQGAYRMEVFVYSGQSLLYLDEDVDFWVTDRSASPFRDVTEQAGLDIAYQQGGSLPSAGNGIAAFDYDNDGLTDLFISNPSGSQTFLPIGPSITVPGAPNYLMRNNGDGTFSDVAAEAGVQGTFATSSYGATWADFNLDGTSDLFVTNRAARNYMYRNNGDGTFTDVGVNAFSFPSYEWSLTPRAADIDADGDYDLYVGRYMAAFSTTWKMTGAKDDLYSNRMVEGEEDVSFAGWPKFTRITATSGVDSVGLALAAFFFDYDRDGKLDLAVHNDFGAFTVSNQLFRGLGGGVFEDVTQFSGYASREFSMGASAADFDGNGFLDSYSSNIGRNSLVFNNGDGTFTLGIAGSGAEGDYMVSGPQADGLNLDDNWGVMSWDYDLDEDIDLYVAGSDLFTNYQMPIAELHPDSVFRNDGTGHFAHVEDELGLQNAARTHSIVSFDIDGDGDLDVITSAENEGMTVMRNDQVLTNSWLRVRPETHRSAPGGFNTVFTVVTPTRTQVHELMAECAHASQPDNAFQFGLGNNLSATRVTAQWTRGGSTTVYGVPGNQEFRMHETVIQVDGKIEGRVSAGEVPDVRMYGEPGRLAIGLIGNPGIPGPFPLPTAGQLNIFPILSPAALVGVALIGPDGSGPWNMAPFKPSLIGLKLELQMVTMDLGPQILDTKSGISTLTVTP